MSGDEQKRFRTIEARLDYFRKAQSEISKRIDEIEKWRSDASADIVSVARQSIEKLSNELSDRAHSILQRYEVFTEVYRSARGEDKRIVADALLFAFDEPDQWWLDRSRLTIKQWREELQRYARDNPLMS